MGLKKHLRNEVCVRQKHRKENLEQLQNLLSRDLDTSSSDSDSSSGSIYVNKYYGLVGTP